MIIKWNSPCKKKKPHQQWSRILKYMYMYLVVLFWIPCLHVYYIHVGLLLNLLRASLMCSASNAHFPIHTAVPWYCADCSGPSHWSLYVLSGIFSV